MPDTDPTTAIVLAGGRGTRLGMNMPKAAVSLCGRTLLARAVATASAAADDVVVVAPADLALPATPARRVDDPPNAGGPLGGILAGLRSVAGCAGPTIVLAVDFPLVRAETLQWLRAALGSDRAVMPAPLGIWQPLVAVYGSDVLDVFERQWRAGVRSIMQAVREIQPRIVGDDELDPRPGGVDEFLNVNTREELAVAEQLMSGG